jgi:hypothetical protein
VYLYYAVSLGLAASTGIILILVFQGRTDDQVVGYREEDNRAEDEQQDEQEQEQDQPSPTVAVDEKATLAAREASNETNANENASEGTAVPELSTDGEAAAAKAARRAATAHQSGSKMRRIVRTPAIWLMSAYILIYVGVEVTIGGWATSFLVDERGGDNSSGYVSSGFFAGLTVGRVVLIPVTAWIGGWRSVWV